MSQRVVDQPLHRHSDHWALIVLYGATPSHLKGQLEGLLGAGIRVCLVNNNPPGSIDTRLHQLRSPHGGAMVVAVENGNRGGLAGGINRGVRAIGQRGGRVFTLLDQDSACEPDTVIRLQERLRQSSKTIVGPRIVERGQTVTPGHGEQSVKMLITSGSTIRLEAWQEIGDYKETFEIDYLDHEWCFRALRLGYQMLQLSELTLQQVFGERHPNWLARVLGCQLYSAYRHECSLRNLKRMLLYGYVPWGWKLREASKMLVKPLIWLSLEGNRRANLIAVVRGLTR